MPQETTAALLDAALFTLQRARAELGGAASTAPASEVPTTALARFVRRYDALDASDFSAEEQAQAYEDSAGVLRRRSARALGDSREAHAEREQRAQYFEARAEHKRAGVPMALALRTGNEHLGYVDALRRELAEFVALVQQISREEVHAFSGAIAGRAMSPDQAAAAFDDFLIVLGSLLFALGVSVEAEGMTFAPYRKLAPGPAAPPMEGPSEEPQPQPQPHETTAPATSNGASA